MQRGPSANNLAFIEYDLAIINADHGPELVIEKLVPVVFDVFRESNPVADCQRDLVARTHPISVASRVATAARCRPFATATAP